jgi:5-oxoprolinase (ATP-hydrolysing) subunit A
MLFAFSRATRLTDEPPARRLNLSADLGEGGPADVEILDFVDSASVACGVHAGSASISISTALSCQAKVVEVGAHPGYDDRAGFGRVDLPLTARDIEALVAFQVAALAAVVPIAYVKPHGALYHRCQADAEAADAVARVARHHGVGLLGEPGELLAAARRAGIPGYREGFADRLLMPDGTLAPRTREGAPLSQQAAAAQAVRLAQTDRFDSLCLHGDGPAALEVARAVRRALTEAGVATLPLAPRPAASS